jgi:hypothetical protein
MHQDKVLQKSTQRNLIQQVLPQLALGKELLRGQTGAQRELLLLKLFLTKHFAKESWFFRVICVPLAAILLRYSLEGDFNVLTTT